ncbi:hypothetical protein N0B31_16025 [Salinirubellus salinus]|uniref:Peptidase S3 domain-containing protein n=1 Tax=Salinirubellus salinus TaxID=1364945 RepID=A0A9E7R161_9EURY|nr:DUF6735 family protein [Salinirubellus salinus]UWM53638.1 hypothetical protein N0B31_16025 [Salinirubellus salinus]
MSSRALVAYERPDGRYDTHEARGELLGSRITTRTPFGGRDRPVEPVPTERGVDRAALAARVAFGRHEALVLVAPDYDTRTFVALPFGVPDAASGTGALVESHGPGDESWLRGWVGGFRGALAEASARGLDAGEASDLLRAEAAGFEREGRTVLRPGGS